tara:strand:- start:612 stop:1715 length:1104 start_codon:yes stop_codon:yes gene_type:complete
MYLRPNKKISIIYLFKNGRKERLKFLENSPSEFFYGFKELHKEGYNVKFLEEIDLNLKFKNFFLNKFFNLLSKIIFNLPFNSIFGFFINKSFKKLNGADYIIPTTNSLGITLSLAKNLGMVKANILFINMGIFSKYPNPFKLFLYKSLFLRVKLLTISKTEYKFLNLLFKDLILRYIPFGVDEKFWYPSQKITINPYILAIGNDLARDWEILLDAWDEDFPTLKLVTSLPVKTLKKNIIVIKGSWHSQALSDLEMRDLYRNSEFVVLPLKETFQPSGQSTCLQAMACSKAVLMSEIKGIWDRNKLKHKENVFFVKPGDKNDLNKSLRFLINNFEVRKKIEKNGRVLVEKHFNVSNMKENLKKIFVEK